MPDPGPAWRPRDRDRCSGSAATGTVPQAGPSAAASAVTQSCHDDTARRSPAGRIAESEPTSYGQPEALTRLAAQADSEFSERDYRHRDRRACQADSIIMDSDNFVVLQVASVHLETPESLDLVYTWYIPYIYF